MFNQGIRYSILILGSIFTCCLFLSCSRNAVFEQSQSVNNEKWDKNISLVFEGLEIADTSGLYNYYLIVRHTRLYPYSNLYLFMRTTLPDQNFFKDTIELILAKPDGQWVGEGFGNIRAYKVLINKSFKFPQPGKYSFKFEQGMRTDELTGIKDVSIQIEKAF